MGGGAYNYVKQEWSQSGEHVGKTSKTQQK